MLRGGLGDRAPSPLRGADLCTVIGMANRRLNVSLDEQHAEKLARLADRARVADGTLARSLLSAATDDADTDSRSITEPMPQRVIHTTCSVLACLRTRLSVSNACNSWLEVAHFLHE